MTQLRMRFHQWCRWALLKKDVGTLGGKGNGDVLFIPSNTTNRSLAAQRLDNQKAFDALTASWFSTADFRHDVRESRAGALV